jgi:hypothetical protein
MRSQEATLCCRSLVKRVDSFWRRFPVKRFDTVWHVTSSRELSGVFPACRVISAVRRYTVLNADFIIKGDRHSLFLACSITDEGGVGCLHREGTLTVLDAVAVLRELVVDD